MELVNPDRALINKKNLELIDYTIGKQTKKLRCSLNGTEWREVTAVEQRKLNSVQLRSVAEMCLDIENIASFACDIEWAMTDERLYLLQVRPITA